MNERDRCEMSLRVSILRSLSRAFRELAIILLCAVLMDKEKYVGAISYRFTCQDLSADTQKVQQNNPGVNPVCLSDFCRSRHLRTRCDNGEFGAVDQFTSITTVISHVHLLPEHSLKPGRPKERGGGLCVLQHGLDFLSSQKNRLCSGHTKVISMRVTLVSVSAFSEQGTTRCV